MVAEQLAAAGYDVFGLDLRGQGTQVWPKDAFTPLVDWLARKF